jgi:hypothetical protein
MKLLKNTIFAVAILVSASLAEDRAQFGIGFDLKNTINKLSGDITEEPFIILNLPTINLNFRSPPEVILTGGFGYAQSSISTEVSTTSTNFNYLGAKDEYYYGTKSRTYSIGMLKFFINPKVIYIKKENIEGTLGGIFEYASIVSYSDQEGAKDVSVAAVNFGLTTGVEYFVTMHFAVSGDIVASYASSTHKKEFTGDESDVIYSSLGITPKINFNWYFN